jgi:hypothetical protein
MLPGWEKTEQERLDVRTPLFTATSCARRRGGGARGRVLGDRRAVWPADAPRRLRSRGLIRPR